MKKDKRKIEEENEDDYGFEGQKSSEEIILLLKRHPMTLYRLGLSLVGGAILVVASYVIFGASRYSSIAFLIYILVGGYYGFKNWYLWWASHYLLTNERVMSIDQLSFFHRTVSEAMLENIINVSFEVSGPYQTFLDYGTVGIITSGMGEPDVKFPAVPHPYDVQQQVTEAIRNFTHDRLSRSDKKTVILR